MGTFALLVQVGLFLPVAGVRVDQVEDFACFGQLSLESGGVLAYMMGAIWVLFVL